MSQDSSQLLQLPYQRLSVDADLSDDELVYQVRLRITSFLNKVTRGERKMEAEMVKVITEFNQLASKYGYPTITYKHLM